MTVMDQHPLGRRVEAMHACPECPLGHPAPFCQVCLGAGIITGDRLDRWSYQQLRADAD